MSTTAPAEDAGLMARNLRVDKDLGDDGVIKVSGGADAQAVASAISTALYDSTDVVIRAVGASAVNQACKAIAIARGYVANRGADLICRPGFTNVAGRDGAAISALVFRVRAM